MLRRTGDDVIIPVDGVRLEGDLVIPQGATGVVIFAHGAGSSRFSPRNAYVADVLRSRRLGTLLFDLLTEAEDRDYERRFDIPLLTDRLLAVTEWLRRREEGRGLRVGYLGSSTGAAAALGAAAGRGNRVGAVVSRGGRVDLASDRLPRITAPTLFVVGGTDTEVLALNRRAYERLACTKDLRVIEGAGHLFEGPGELESVAEIAADWFERSLAPTTGA